MTPGISAAEMADRIALDTDGWTIAVFARDALDHGAEELAEEIGFMLEEEDGDVRHVQASKLAEGLVDQLSGGGGDGIVLVRGLESVPPNELERLDLLRNRMLSRRVVIATTSEGARLLAQHAPNLWSWIGPRCFEVGTKEGVMDPEQRLASLRTFHDMSDAQVIERAQGGTLPLDPTFAEWLVLLERGDLVGH